MAIHPQAHVAAGYKALVSKRVATYADDITGSHVFSAAPVEELIPLVVKTSIRVWNGAPGVRCFA